MQGRGVAVGRATEMWERLFGAREQWGWEFTPPAPITASPEAANPPAAEQVYAPHDYQFRERRSKRAWLGLLGWLALTVVLVVLVGAMAETVSAKAPKVAEVSTTVVLALGVLLAIIHFFRTRRRFSVMKRTYKSHYDRALETYTQAHFAWEQRVKAHDDRERGRVDSAMLWQPVKLASRPSRIDVFGGTEDSWASLLTTAGAAQLAGGASILLLDFTSMAIGDDLTLAAAGKGYGVSVRVLPEELGEFALLADLDPHELAEVLAGAMHSLNRTAMAADLRGLHADLIATVAERLTGPVTFRKLSAGLQVLRRVYDAGADDTLTAEELRKLNSYVDTVGNTDQVRNELIALEGELRGPAKAEGAQAAGEPAGFGTSWPARGLSVIATRTKIERHKRFLDQLVFHRALQELQSRETTGREVIVVAGADQIALEALETMARQARRARIQLVFIVGHLRDDMQKLLGSSGSASLLMRMGNGDEATTAAEYIGRGFKFVLSQLTEEMGKTFTDGRSGTEGVSVSNSSSRGYSFGGTSSHSFSGDGHGSSSSGSSWSRNSSTSTSRELNWSETRSESEATSRSEGQTMARVYEFQVEPTTLQSLAPTAYVLVEAAPGGRRVVMGDCNPGIVLLDRVARDALPR